MKELVNSITITGDLVKVNLEEKEITSKKDNVTRTVLSGDVILRTADGSEFNVNLFSNKFKKDSDETSFFYNQYNELLENAVSVENAVDGQSPSVVTINAALDPNDYKSKNGNVVSSTRINGRFVKIESDKDSQIIAKEAKFNIGGIIKSIDDEIVKDVPTGNKTVVLLPIKQKTEDYTKEDAYEADEIFEVSYTLPTELVQPFMSVGYCEGQFAEFSGVMINTVEVKKETVQQAFGNPIEKETKKIVRSNTIKSGTMPVTIYDIGLTDEVVEALKSRRQVKLQEIQSANGSNGGNVNSFGKAPTPAQTSPVNTGYNPFAK